MELLIAFYGGGALLDQAEQLERYIQGYLQLRAQAPEEALTDQQLASITLSINELIAATPSGSIIDVGAGKGILLERLANNAAFLSANEWVYVATDTDEALDEIGRVARKCRLSRRLEPVALNEFYTSWPAVEKPQVVVCRNVLHELNISETTALFSHLSNNMGATDVLILQDVLKLPEAERGSVCWISMHLLECLEQFGFVQVAASDQYSRTGQYWLSAKLKKNSECGLSVNAARDAVLSARHQQWNLWSQLEAHKSNTEGISRGDLVEALDIDLQFAGLTRQLMNSGAIGLQIDAETQKRIRQNEFTGKIANFLKSNVRPNRSIKSNIHFRERGTPLNQLEDYLRSDNAVALVYGGLGTGKTTLVRHLLETRAFDKWVVTIDGRKTTTFWNFIEQLLAQVGLRVAPELLSVLTTLTPSSVGPVLKQFTNAFADRTIIFFDNISELYSKSGALADSDLEWFLQNWISKPRAKFIAAGRAEYLPRQLQSAGGKACLVKVGRFGENKTVINILDDHFDRASAGVEKYPDSLINAIDCHPLIASLAAQNLKKHGSDLLLDEKFVTELRQRMRDELWSRLLDNENKSAVEFAARLRIPVPRKMLLNFVSAESIDAALASDLLYTTYDNRWDELLGVLGLFRIRSVANNLDGLQEEYRKETPADHAAIAAAYRKLYKEDDDPQWIRESYYHSVVSEVIGGDGISTSLGRYYFDELVASGDYAYVRKRDYALALQLYDAAREIGKLAQISEMRRASSLIREGFRQRGDGAFESLVRDFPDRSGIKRSHIDALLFVDDYSEAQRKLTEYELSLEDYWVRYQWGRTYLGLDMYKQAADMFGPLVNSHGAEPHFHIFLSRALFYSGNYKEAVQVLERAHGLLPDEFGVSSALGVMQEQTGDAQRAYSLLVSLFVGRDDNVTAAPSLIRMHSAEGRIGDALEIFQKVRKSAPKAMREELVVAEVELNLGRSQYKRAIDQAISFEPKSTYIIHAALRACLFAGERASGSDQVQYLQTGLELGVPESLRLNAPIQEARMRIALLSKDKAIALRCAENLRETAYDRACLGKLETLCAQISLTE